MQLTGPAEAIAHACVQIKVYSSGGAHLKLKNLRLKLEHPGMAIGSHA